MIDDVRSVLVVDDEPGIRQGCRKVLEPLGYQVESAETIKAALTRIEQTDFDLVLIDVMMPDGRGIDLLEPILARDADTVCVIITGYATVELAVQAIKQCAYDFLAKPFDADVLELTVRQGIERRRLALEAKRARALETQLDDLQHEKAELARLDKFKTNFMWMMAHELRSPLGASQSLLRTILKGMAGALSEDQHELLSRVELRLSGLQTLVNDLLGLAASKNPELELQIEQLNLVALLMDVTQELAPKAEEKGVHLRYKPQSTPLFIHSSSDGLKTILSNLLDNAIKYTPEGGSVTLNVYAQDNDVEIQVTDTGIGIPVEGLEHLGEEFFRAPNARHTGLPGTGLGLSIVKQVLDRLGGHLEVRSVQDQGTTFTVCLPKLKEAVGVD